MAETPFAFPDRRVRSWRRYSTACAKYVVPKPAKARNSIAWNGSSPAKKVGSALTSGLKTTVPRRLFFVSRSRARQQHRSETDPSWWKIGNMKKMIKRTAEE